MRFRFSIPSCINISTHTDLLFSQSFIDFYRFFSDRLAFSGVRPVPFPIKRSKILSNRGGEFALVRIPEGRYDPKKLKRGLKAL